MITRSAASGLCPPCILPTRCNVKESMMVTSIRKRRRSLSSGRLSEERGGRGGSDGDERNRREVDMSVSTKTHGNKGTAVVVNGGHRRSGKGGSVPIVEKMGESSSSSIAMKRECSSCEHGKKKRGKPLLVDLNKGAENSRRLSFSSSNTDDVIVLEHVNSPRTPVGRNPPHLMHRFFTPQAADKCRSSSISSINLHVEDMCFSNLLHGNCISPRPSLAADHSPKIESDLCRAAILKNALASGVFPNSPSEIDADGLSQWLDTQKNLDETVL